MQDGRHYWVVDLPASVVREAAEKKWAYHTGRTEWWKVKLDEAEAALKELGIDFRSNAISGGYRTDVVIDPERQRRVNECREKVQSHNAAALEYEGFGRFLAMAEPGSVSLRPEDVVFFDLQPEKK